MKIKSINKIGNEISIITDNGESAVFTPFAKTIYTQTSAGLLKKNLVEFKKDIITSGWDVEQLKKWYL